MTDHESKPTLPEFARYGWIGNYSSYSDALQECAGGYETPGITEKKIARTESVRNEPVSNSVHAGTFRLMNLLDQIARRLNHRKLSVVDLGGELGVHLFRLRHYLDCPEAMFKLDFDWNVIEMPERVAAGRKRYGSELQFFESVSELKQKKRGERFDVLFSRGAIQYFDDPIGSVAELSSLQAPYLLLEALPTIPQKKDRLTIQHVPPRVYDAKIPHWFFSEEKFETAIRKIGWKMLLKWGVHEDYIELDGTTRVKYGYLFERDAK